MSPIDGIPVDAIIAAIRRGRPHCRYVVYDRTMDMVYLTDYVDPLHDRILHDDDAE